jgi:hypothetical protein
VSNKQLSCVRNERKEDQRACACIHPSQVMPGLRATARVAMQSRPRSATKSLRPLSGKLLQMRTLDTPLRTEQGQKRGMFAADRSCQVVDDLVDSQMEYLGDMCECEAKEREGNVQSTSVSPRSRAQQERQRRRMQASPQGMARPGLKQAQEEAGLFGCVGHHMVTALSKLSEEEKRAYDLGSAEVYELVNRIECLQQDINRSPGANMQAASEQETSNRQQAPVSKQLLELHAERAVLVQQADEAEPEAGASTCEKPPSESEEVVVSADDGETKGSCLGEPEDGRGGAGGWSGACGGSREEAVCMGDEGVGVCAHTRLVAC